MFNREKDQYRSLENDNPGIVGYLSSRIISVDEPVKSWIGFNHLVGCNDSGNAIISFVSVLLEMSML